jgi:hypothetical protein
MDLGDRLRSLGLERYEAAFRANAIEADVLHDLTDQDLEKVLLGHRRRLLRSIAELDGAPAAAITASSAPLGVKPALRYSRLRGQRTIRLHDPKLEKRVPTRRIFLCSRSTMQALFANRPQTRQMTSVWIRTCMHLP